MDFNAMKLVLIGILSLLFLNNVAMGSTVQTTVAPTNPLDNIDTTVETIDVTGVDDSLTNTIPPMVLGGLPNKSTCTDGTNCLNGGTCDNGSCVCTGEYGGPLCNISLTCPSSYCNLHNTKNCTVEVKDGQAVYKCLCQSVFWIGNQCDVYDYCLSYPCQNRGTCELTNERSFMCHCMTGDQTKNCRLNEADECKNRPPVGTDYFITCIDRIGGYDLICAPGYTRPNDGCGYRENPTTFCTKYNQNCTNEGYCKPLCNVEVCNGTSNCNFTTKPFPDTNTTDDCEMRFADGYLETKCSSEDMLFDGNDAIVHKLTDCSPFFDTVCTGKFGNNVCDPECDNADCLYDGWDCAENHDDTLDKQLPGGVVIDFARRPKSLFQNKLSMLTRTFLNVTLDKSGKTAYMKVRAENFTTVANVTRFLAGAIAKLPYLIDYVTDVFVCEAGMWNPSTKCSQKCGSTCLPQGDEICHWETGACLHGCNDGFYGGTCSMACPPGCKDTCYVKDGTPLCSECKPGFFLQTCNATCDRHCRGGMCQFRSGTCTCSDGRLWSNQTNSCQCQHGWFGSRCTEKCNSNCEGGGCIEVSGACAMGCISGYYGPDCSKECVGCDNCDEKGTCPLKPEKKTVNDDSNSDSVVIAIVVVAVLVLCIYVFVVCICKSDCQRAKRWYLRRRGQSGEYPIEDDDDVIKDPVPESEAFLSATGVSGLQPTSPKVGRSKDMIDMDIMEVPAVYDGRKSGPTLEPLQKEPKDGSPESRQPADGASEAEPEAHVNDRGRFASSVVIEVDGKGRLLSITDRDQVPSPSALKEAPDDEVFSVEINDAEKSHDFPHIDEDITPPQSPLGESRAPLASEENILNDLGPRMSVKSGGSEDKNRKGSSRSTSSSSTNSSRKSSSMKSGSRKSSSRTSSSSSHSSRDESNKEHVTEM
ncbi:neurogenic locus notch homolog protein 1-like isoform X2 [Mya arenaria]|uniref:neurogenic locus notch homolog protein 1-like isoform X2 n=1 Tax=Mya arenaria TaxID=6604 RepID=UPI0022E8A2E2|nr:neurogenic locus notch homolog protein 1-like isoform X2 [Mya arenaria]